MAAKHTIFMTPEESERVQRTVRTRVKKCQEQLGQQWEPNDPTSLIQQATSASLMQDLSSAAFGLGKPSKSRETMVAFAVGCPYLPSLTKLEQLEPMKISNLCLETHHRGRVLSLRRVSPVVQLQSCSWAVVQGDSSAETERLELFLHTLKHGRDVLDMSSEFLIKEPYYTLNTDGERTIRIDHPSDLIITSYSDGPEAWRIKERSDQENEEKPAAKWKELGNAALQKGDLARAHAHYTEGLGSIAKAVEPDRSMASDLHRNRSHVNILLQCFDEAKSDALSSLTGGEEENPRSLDAKAYYRAGLAAYGLGDFLDARRYFQEQEKLQPDNQYAKHNLRKIEKRLEEQTNGIYDLKRVVGSLSKNQGRPDVASFVGHTEVRESPGAGRGLFATRDIEPNEIIMCERAFAVAWSYERDAFSALTCDVRDDANIRVFPAGLLMVVVQKLANNPSQIERFLDLCGEYKGLGNKFHECDGSPVIDTFQIHDIVQRNTFSAGQQTDDEDVSNASTGIWIRASYINHSCVSNSKKDFVGDLMILRATRRIATGEEITHGYDESTDYDTRAAALERTWGFSCKCKLCQAEEADGPEVRKRRREIEEEANGIMSREEAAWVRKISVNKVKRIRQALNETYDKQRYKGLPRRALFGIDYWLQKVT